MKELKNINTRAILDFAAKNADLFATKKSPQKILNQISDILILFLEIEKHHYKEDYQALLDRMALIDQGYSFDEVLEEIPHFKTAQKKKVVKKTSTDKTAKKVSASKKEEEKEVVKKTSASKTTKKVSAPKKVEKKKVVKASAAKTVKKVSNPKNTRRKK